MRKQKKILCLIDSLASGGAQRQMVGLASLLKQNGYQVKIISYYDIPFYLSQLKENNVDYECLPCGKGLFSRLYWIRKSINSYVPDVVISYLDTPNILACILHITSKKRWKLIVSERNTTQRLSLRERIKFSLYRFADFIVPNSYSQGDFINKNYPYYANKCHVITNFVDTDTFRPVKTKENRKVLRIIGVGRVLRQKNIPMLIEAVNCLNKQGGKLHVDWYGKKFDSYDECMQLIDQYALNDTFKFHEPCADIISKFQESDIFVLPSIYEGFPNVLCEAMSCGLPVIATDICDNRRIMRNNENGYLIPSGDAVLLSQRLIQFMGLSREQRAEMGDRSRNLAMETFSKGEFLKDYVKLLE